jgi:hypothetical protein
MRGFRLRPGVGLTDDALAAVAEGGDPEQVIANDKKLGVALDGVDRCAGDGDSPAPLRCAINR